MTQDGTPKDDVKVPEGDLGKQIEQEFDGGKDLLVTIVSAMGEEQVNLSCSFPLFVTFIFGVQAISFKEAPKGS